MKIKLYTRSHDTALLKKVDNNGGKFTAEEFAWVIRQESGKNYESKNSLLQYYLSQNWKKLTALTFLIEYILKHDLKNVISLGAGQCVFEYLLQCALPSEFKVIATDFNSFFIEKSKLLFPSITSAKFDFVKDDIGKFQDSCGVHFNLAIFVSAAYVMEDSEFVHLFKSLKENGIKHIICFMNSYIPHKTIFATIFNRTKSYILGKLRQAQNEVLKKKKVTKEPMFYRGKFHGYARTRRAYRKLFKNAGIHLAKETSIYSYNYVTIYKKD